MSLQRSDISSPFLGGAVGAAIAVFFFPPGSVSWPVSMVAGLLGGATGFGLLECLAGSIFATKPPYRAAYITGLVVLASAAYFVINEFSPRLNSRFIYTLF